MKKVLNVGSVTQKALFEEEILGQLSDGAWENASPLDHWIPWSEAEVVVDPTNVGRNFHAPKTSYALNGRELLEIIGDRMVEIGKKASGDESYDMPRLVSDLRGLKKAMKSFSRSQVNA